MLLENVQTFALLVHQHTVTKNIDITTHKVLSLSAGQHTLGAGRAMTGTDKDALLGILLDEDQSVDFIPENVLISTRTVLAWYREPEVREIPFKDGVQVNAPLPGLVFIARDGQPLRTYAYKGRKRPTPDTELYFTPLGNVYESGTTCTGNVNVPRNVSVANVPKWESFILDARNTHLSGIVPIKGITDFAGLVGFYKSLEEKAAKTFPAKRLVAAKLKEHNGDTVPLTLNVAARRVIK